MTLIWRICVRYWGLVLIYGQTTVPNPSSHISAYVSQGIFEIAEDDYRQ